MSNFIDLSGNVYGRLTVVKRAANIGGKASWVCKCECGKISNPTSTSLRSGKTQSCGCLQKELQSKRISARNFVHGHNFSGTGNQSPEWNSWSSMRKRCLNPNNTNYPRYGGRGVTVCEQWADFLQFYADMGKRPVGHTLDRIDVDGNYEPSNCRWATLSQQQRNKRCHKK